jgi:hypothetical protein
LRDGENLPFGKNRLTKIGRKTERKGIKYKTGRREENGGRGNRINKHGKASYKAATE